MFRYDDRRQINIAKCSGTTNKCSRQHYGALMQSEPSGLNLTLNSINHTTHALSYNESFLPVVMHGGNSLIEFNSH